MKRPNAIATTVLILGASLAARAHGQERPNILIIWGDDIGYWNVSAYNQGMMGYKTPNIDRIAREGALFTDWYGQQSCTAGRACFITGKKPTCHHRRRPVPATAPAPTSPERPTAALHTPASGA